jgi:uncharacterized protein YrrD
MLYSISDLDGLPLRATDGTIGSVHDFYFDDATWTIRYMVADTGTWLSGRHVLIVPQAVGQPDLINRVVPVQLTQEQVRNSPDWDHAKPLSRVMEERLYRHYGWEPYWGEAGLPFAGATDPRAPDMIGEGDSAAPSGPAEQYEMQGLMAGVEPNLRSAETVMDYYIHARDGDIGHVDDFIVDHEAWAIRYMVVDTGNWLPGRKVLISPQWIEDMSWSEQKVMLDLTRNEVRHSPDFNAGAKIERPYEKELFEYYKRAPYWGM